jgi:hypothetical protein
MKKVFYKWKIPNLKWYQKLYMVLTLTEVTDDGKHITYRKKLGKEVFVDRYKKGRI